MAARTADMNNFTSLSPYVYSVETLFASYFDNRTQANETDRGIRTVMSGVNIPSVVSS